MFFRESAGAARPLYAMDMCAGETRQRTLWHVRLGGAGAPWPKERDRFVFLALLRRALRRQAAACLGWCLLGNEAQLLAAADSLDGLREVVEEARKAYARYWHGWYAPRRVFRWARAVAVPPALAWDVLAHMETEPVRAGHCRTAEAYRWSSAPAHAGWAPSYLPLAAWSAEWTCAQWRQRLEQWNVDPGKWLGVMRLLRGSQPLRRRARETAPAAMPLFPARAEAARAAGGWI